jgi:hypothetical protein
MESMMSLEFARTGRFEYLQSGQYPVGLGCVEHDRMLEFRKRLLRAGTIAAA